MQLLNHAASQLSIPLRLEEEFRIREEKNVRTCGFRCVGVKRFVASKPFATLANSAWYLAQLAMDEAGAMW